MRWLRKSYCLHVGCYSIAEVADLEVELILCPEFGRELSIWDKEWAKQCPVGLLSLLAELV